MNAILRRRRALMMRAAAAPSPVLPDEYQAVECITSSYKANNYVLTDVPVKDASRVVIDGTVYSGSDNCASLCFYQASNNAMRLGYFNNSTYNQGYTCRPSVAMGDSETGTFTFSRNAPHATETASLYLFGGPTGNTARSRVLSMNSAAIYDDNSTLQFRGVPVYRKSDNKMGLYDFVGRAFHEAVGTFTKGGNV